MPTKGYRTHSKIRNGCVTSGIRFYGTTERLPFGLKRKDGTFGRAVVFA